MIEMGLARVLHVVGVVLWIGGVAMVTTVILPAVKRLASADTESHCSKASSTALPGRHG